MQMFLRLQAWATATRLRTYAVLVLFAIVPLALFLFSADQFLRRDTTRKVTQQSVEATNLVAERFEERFTSATTLVGSFATRPSLVQAYKANNFEEIDQQLEQGRKLAVRSTAIAIFGTDGSLRTISPRDQSDRYKTAAQLKWFAETGNRQEPYISDVIVHDSKTNDADIAVSMPLRDTDGHVVAVLAIFYPTSLIHKWTAGLGKNISRFVFLVDRQGDPVAAADLSLSTAHGSLKQIEPVRRVLLGQSGGGAFDMDGNRYQAEYKPIGSTGWGVVIALPFRDIQAAVSTFEKPLAVIGIVFLGIALGFGSLGANVFRRLRDSEAQTRTVIETAHDGFIAFDDHGVVSDWNHQAEEIFGWSRLEAVGSPVGELVIPVRHRQSNLERLERHRTTGEGVVLGKRNEMTAIDKLGREFPVEITIAALRTRGKQYFNVFVRDITEQQRNKETIEAKNRELDLRNREVERANHLKSQFLASMSHELRTPLNAILGFSDLLSDGSAGTLNEKQSRWVDHIRKGGKHLLQLINDILDLSKIEAGQVELILESFKVSDALPEVISNIRQLAMAKRLRLDIECSPNLQVRADRLRFKQILYNLLSNAVKFTPEAGSVRVEGTLNGERVEFTIADTGVGIRSEDLEVIFDEFRQVGDTTRGVREGTGLGLAITKRLVEQMGGTITVSSVVGEGTRFTFTLPISSDRIETAPVAQPPIPNEADLPVVLIVDDEPAACELMAGYLVPEGFSTAAVHSGVEAMNLARKLKPACVILDILMPSGSGWETLHEFRQHPDTRDIPIIVVSIVEQRRLGMALGAADYLIKPVERESLLASVERLVRVRHSDELRCVAADDDPTALRLIADTLTDAGFSVDVASNGRQALEKLRVRRTDLLLLDLMMPEMDGFEVLRQCADDPTLSNVPVVVLTGKDLSQDEIDLLGRSAKGVFQKDGEWRARLLANLRKVINHRPNASGMVS